MKKDIVLIGGGGHCNAVIDVIESTSKFNIVGIVDQKEKIGQSVLGYKIIGCDDDLKKIRTICDNAIITLGHIMSCDIRKKIALKLERLNFSCPSIISPVAYIAKNTKILDGTVVMHHALVNTNAMIGKHCIINSKALVEHDAVIHDFCHISTAAVVNGGVEVQEGCFFGSNATSKQAIQVNGFIKAGSIVK